MSTDMVDFLEGIFTFLNYRWNICNFDLPWHPNFTDLERSMR